MIAQIIKDQYRPHSNETLDDELDLQEIDHLIWPACHEPADTVASINKSHKKIVEYAKDKGLPEICILEEDVMFLSPGAWQYFLDNKPKDFDLYLGGCYGLNQEAYKRIAEGKGAVPIHNFAGLHCYIISESYYEKFLALPVNKHIDDQPGMGRFYVCSPFIALQHPGWSSNNKEKVNYHKNFRKELPYNCLYSWERISENL